MGYEGQLEGFCESGLLCRQWGEDTSARQIGEVQSSGEWAARARCDWLHASIDDEGL